MDGDHAEADNHQKKTAKRAVTIRCRVVELACRSIVNQLVSSIPKDVRLRRSYVECQQSTATKTSQEINVELRFCVTRRVQFTDTKEEYEPSSDCSSGEEALSGESCTFEPGLDELSGRQCRSDQGTEFCPGSRLQSDQAQNPLAQVLFHSLSCLRLGRTGQKLHPIQTSQK